MPETETTAAARRLRARVMVEERILFGSGGGIEGGVWYIGNCFVTWRFSNRSDVEKCKIGRAHV